MHFAILQLIAYIFFSKQRERRFYVYFSDGTDHGLTLFIEILLFACTFSFSMILKMF